MGKFTSWTALRQRLLDDMATGSWRTQSYTYAGQSRTFRSFAEIRQALEYVEYRASIENGTQQRHVPVRPGGLR